MAGVSSLACPHVQFSSGHAAGTSQGGVKIEKGIDDRLAGVKIDRAGMAGRRGNPHRRLGPQRRLVGLLLRSDVMRRYRQEILAKH